MAPTREASRRSTRTRFELNRCNIPPKPKKRGTKSAKRPDNEEGSPALVDRNDAIVVEVSMKDTSRRDRVLAVIKQIECNAELTELQNNRSKAMAEFVFGKESQAEKKALTERLNKVFDNFEAELKGVLKNLSKNETLEEQDTIRHSLESEKKVWEGEKKELTESLDQALKQRDLALNELYDLGLELKEVENYRSRALAEFELGKKVLEAEKKALTERLDKEFSNFAAELKEVLESLSKSKSELERAFLEHDSYRNSLELGKKEWADEKKALTERLNKDFNNFGAELNEVLKNLSKSEVELKETSQERDTYGKCLELGKKMWEAERIELETRLAMANKEKENALAENTAMMNKEKETAYGKGYLDGWVKKPQAYLHAGHVARLDNDVTDLPALQRMNKLPKSHV